jgi:hypothetical protein
MNDGLPEAPAVAPGPPLRIGVILDPLRDLNKAALRYLIVHLNTLQTLFEFELLSAEKGDPVVAFLQQETPVSSGACQAMLFDFGERVISKVVETQQRLGLADRSLPGALAVICQAKFADGLYSVKDGPVVVQALGNWDRSMAPPSIFEFILTLLIRQGAGLLVPSMAGGIHLGTKGCIFDFTENLDEARYKALQSYVCSACRRRLAAQDAGSLADEIVRVVDMKWLGRLCNPYSPAAIVSKLGYNLFVTKGVRPTWRESALSGFRDAGVKETIRLVSSVVLAGLLLWLGLKGRATEPAPAQTRHTTVSDGAGKADASKSTGDSSSTSTTTSKPPHLGGLDATQSRKATKKVVPFR